MTKTQKRQLILVEQPSQRKSNAHPKIFSPQPSRPRTIKAMMRSMMIPMVSMLKAKSVSRYSPEAIIFSLSYDKSCIKAPLSINSFLKESTLLLGTMIVSKLSQ